MYGQVFSFKTGLPFFLCILGALCRECCISDSKCKVKNCYLSSAHLLSENLLQAYCFS